MSICALPAYADIHEIGIAKQFGAACLQVIVMKHEHLVEKHLREAGLPEVRVNWVTLSSGATVNDALLSGGVQLVPGGPAPFDTPSPNSPMQSRLRRGSPIHNILLGRRLDHRKPDHLRTVVDFRLQVYAVPLNIVGPFGRGLASSGMTLRDNA